MTSIVREPTEQKPASKLFFLNPWVLAGFLTTFYVAARQPNVDGAGLYYTIPLTFAVCSFLFGDIISFHRGGFGLKVFYVVAVCRYILLPLLTAVNGSFSSLRSEAAMRYAIIMTDVELILCCVAIKIFYPREQAKQEKRLCERVYYDDISAGGWLFVIAAIGLILLRGPEKLFASMRFGIVTEKLDTDVYYGYDIWLAHTLLAFFVIASAGSFQKRNNQKASVVNMLIPLAFVLLSCLMIFGNNRMTIVYFALSGLMVLMRVFPKQKKLVTLLVFPAMLVVIVSFTMTKQYSIDVTDQSSGGVDLRTVTETLSAYVCGVETMAKSYDMYALTGHQMQMFTWLSDIVAGTKIFGLPGLQVIQQHFASIPTSVDLATTSTEMVSVAGQTLFYGGYGFGWLLDIVSHVAVMWLLVKFEVKSKTVKSTGSIYLYTWLSVCFAMVMCYCLWTLYSNVSYIPLFAYITLKVNRLIRFKKTSIKTKEGAAL